jgi:hypothetical protein
MHTSTGETHFSWMVKVNQGNEIEPKGLPKSQPYSLRREWTTCVYPRNFEVRFEFAMAGWRLPAYAKRSGRMGVELRAGPSWLHVAAELF